jgi:hypothetical protein
VTLLASVLRPHHLIPLLTVVPPCPLPFFGTAQGSSPASVVCKTSSVPSRTRGTRPGSTEDDEHGGRLQTGLHDE